MNYGWDQDWLLPTLTTTSTGIYNYPPAGDPAYTNLSKVSDFLGRAQGVFPGLRVTSAYRSPEVNKKVGGASDSSHMKGTAVDFSVSGKTGKDLATWFYENIADWPEIDKAIWYTDTNHIHVTVSTSGKGRGQFLKGTKATGKYVSWSPDGSSFPWLYVALGVGGLAIIGGAVYYRFGRE